MKFFGLLAAATIAMGVELKSQSPIDLPADAKPVPNKDNFAIAFNSASAKVAHDTHTIKATWTAGANSHLTLNGHVYNSLQFHPHSPSEHTIGGVQHPFEVHFVHADKDKNLAVVGVFFKLDKNDKPNKFLEQVWNGIGNLTKPGDSYNIDNLDPSSLRMTKSNVFRYPGSLTTPPYTEGVEWTVLQEVQTMSKGQLEAWTKVIHEPNARPVQPLNERVVTLFDKPRKPAC